MPVLQQLREDDVAVLSALDRRQGDAPVEAPEPDEVIEHLLVDPGVSGGPEVTYPVIFSFELLNQRTLSEKGVLGILKLSYSKVPGLRKLLGE